MDTLSPDERTAANPYSSPVSGERSRARSSSYYAGAPRAHDMSRDSEDEEYDSEYTDLCASDDDEEWLPEMMESGTDSDDAAADRLVRRAQPRGLLRARPRRAGQRGLLAPPPLLARRG